MNRFVRVLRFVAIGVVIAAVLSFIVMQLWNHLLPELVGAHTITFWQAVGLLILSKILFGGFRRPGSPPAWAWKRRMAERWEKMTPEEREKFRAGWGRCGHWNKEELSERKA
jgi:Ca2+/H+ antiporter, TMEM165/GDT1 family